MTAPNADQRTFGESFPMAMSKDTLFALAGDLWAEAVSAANTKREIVEAISEVME